jgi:ABC-2 type transport system ATP-binding protein
MIEVDALVKRYGEIAAVDGVSFRIAAGEVVGLLGQNGAGKSTTMRILVGFRRPDSGTVTVAGRRVDPDDAGSRRAIGYLPESMPLYPRMRVLEALEFVARLRGLAPPERVRALERVLVDCDLGGHEGRRIAALSKGYRQRVGLAQALIGDPTVLVLDEPTSGLDPAEVGRIRSLVRRLAREKTILLSTHVLSEVQELCPRVIVLARGKVVADGSTVALGGSDEVELSVVVAGARTSDEALSVLASVEGVRAARALGTDAAGRMRAALVVEQRFETAARVARAVGRARLELVELHHEEQSLERAFLALTDAPLAGGEAPARASGACDGGGG